MNTKNPAIAIIIGGVVIVATVVTLRFFATKSPIASTPAATCQQRLDWVATDSNTTLLAIASVSQQDTWAVGAKGERRNPPLGWYTLE